MVFSLQLKRRIIIGIVLTVLAISYLFKGTSFWIRGLSMIAFLLLFYVIDYYFDVKFKPLHYLLALIIMVSGILLSPLYFTYYYYDKILHFSLPILYCFIVLHMIAKLHIKVKWEFLFAFFVVTASLALFEIGEYGLDQFSDFKLQGVFSRDTLGLEKYDLLQDKLTDTMNDLIFGILGTLSFIMVKAIIVISTQGYHYLHKVRRSVPPHRKY